MKCECDRCSGTGQVTCDECDGRGTYVGEIQDMKIERNVRHYDALIEVQKDANRVIRQAARLKELNPSRADSYQKQLTATLFVINAEADRISELKEGTK